VESETSKVQRRKATFCFFLFTFYFLLPTLTCLAGVAAQSGSPPSSGDASAGKLIFEGEGRCLTCHSVNDRGESLGPELSWIGLLRTPESLRTSVTNPDAQVAGRYFTVVLETRTGERIEGLWLNEDDFSIQIRDANRSLRSFVKSDLLAFHREPRSLMQSHGPKLSPDDIEHLVSYLRTLRTLWAPAPDAQRRQIAPPTENAAFFDRPGRDRDDQPDELMRALELRPGSAIADIGAGTGYFTWRLAERVGQTGKVFAVDVQQNMLDITRLTVERHGLGNVEYLLAGDGDPKLPARSIDMAFIAYAFHEFARPAAMVAAIRRALKPGGRIFVLEYAREAPAAPASHLHRMGFDEIRREIEPHGFVVDRMFDFLPVQHGIVFAMR